MDVASTHRRSFVHIGQYGFGLLELLTALAFLVIVMGLMVSLARYVRATSAERITRGLLRELNDKLIAAGPDAWPEPEAIPADGAVESDWADYAKSAIAPVAAFSTGGEPVTDAWGNPIIYLPAAHPEFGMAPGDRPFFVSPGPDGRFLTQADNLYSYEALSPVSSTVDTTKNSPATASLP